MERDNFGLKRTGTIYDTYKGRWVNLNTINNFSVCGKIQGIKDDYILLSPYQGDKWREDGRRERTIIGGNLPQAVSIGSITNIQPITKKSLENYCKKMNEKSGIEK